MARLETRITEYDGILFKPTNANWNFLKRSDQHRTQPKTWHRVKVNINKNCIEFYKNGELIGKHEGSEVVPGKIGLFNELADVHIDNIVITAH